jgi:hypothetical protein
MVEGNCMLFMGLIHVKYINELFFPLHIEFPHICNIYDDNTMFYIDLWGFTNDPLYLIYKSIEQKFLVLCIFHFQRPIGSQIELGFLEHHYFIRRSTLGPRSTLGRA